MAQPKPYAIRPKVLTEEEGKRLEEMIANMDENHEAAIRRKYGEVDVVALVRRDRDEH